MTDIGTGAGYGVYWRDRGPFWRRGQEHFETIDAPCDMDHNHAEFTAHALTVLGRRSVRMFRRTSGSAWELERRFGTFRSLWRRAQWKQASN